MRISFGFFPKFSCLFPRINLLAGVRAIASRSFACLSAFWTSCSSRFFGRGSAVSASPASIPRVAGGAPLPVSTPEQAPLGGAAAPSPALTLRERALAAAEARFRAAPAVRQAPPVGGAVPPPAPVTGSPSAALHSHPPSAVASASRPAVAVEPRAGGILFVQQVLVVYFLARMIITTASQSIMMALQFSQDATKTATELRRRVGSITDSTNLVDLRLLAERTAVFCRFRLVCAQQKKRLIDTIFGDVQMPLPFQIARLSSSFHLYRHMLACKTAEACVDILNGEPLNYEELFAQIRIRAGEEAHVATEIENETITAEFLAANEVLQREADEYQQFLGRFPAFVEARQAALR